MDALTREILDSLRDINRRFKFLETQINRLERRAFTPAENMRFYLELVARVERPECSGRSIEIGHECCTELEDILAHR